MKASQPYLQFYDSTKFSISLSRDHDSRYIRWRKCIYAWMAGTSGGVLEELDGSGARSLWLHLTLFSLPCGSHTVFELSVAAEASSIWRPKQA
jgi:hypothetical protein